MKKVIYLVLFAVLFLSCSGDKVAGTISDTDTGKSAMVYNADLTPAVGAVVKFFEINDTEPSFETKTDDKGQYTFAGLEKGTYNVIANKDSSIAFQDSVFISPSANSLLPDTLGKSGSFSGIVELQVNHNPSTVTVQVLGTNIYSEVDSKGWFTLKPLAKGEYNLRLVTILPDYSPTFKSIKVKGGKKDTLSDTIFLKYTGIPVVTGLRTSYDTLNGVVHLSWNKASYYDFQEYLIFRDDFDSINLSDLPIAARGDTVFTDTIFKRKLNSGPFSFKDTNRYHLKYRVCIRNNSLNQGDTYKYIGVFVISPKAVVTNFMTSALQILKGVLSDTCSINDTVRFASEIFNESRKMISIEYSDVVNGAIIKYKTIDSLKSFKDTIYYSWSTAGNKTIEVSIKDAAGTIWKDIVHQYVIKNFPVVRIDSSKIILNSPSTLTAIVNDRFANVTKCEWRIGDENLFTVTSSTKPETTIFVTDMVQPFVKCYLRATNSNGNITIDSADLPITIEWQKVTTLSNMTGNDKVIAFNNQLVSFHVTRDEDEYSQNCNLSTGISSDGINWEMNCQPFLIYPSVRPVVYNGKIWVLGPLGPSGPAGNIKTIYYSSDAISWDSIKLPFNVNLLNDNISCLAGDQVIFTAFQNKLVLGYSGRYINGRISSSINGSDWETDTISFPPEGYYTAINDNCLYRFLGMDEVWSVKDWKPMNLITKKAGRFSVNYPVIDFCGNLGIFTENGQLIVVDHYNGIWKCSDLPTTYISNAFVFNKKLYIMGFANNNLTLWVSKIEGPN